jgi:hypothetical protein
MARSKTKRPTTDAARHVSWAHSVRRLWEDIRIELAAGDTCTVRTLQPDDSLFVELADLAQVSSPEGTERLRRGVSYELSLHRTVPPPLADKKQAASSKKLARAQLRESTRLSRDLAAMVSNLNGQASCALDVVYDRPRRKTVGVDGTPEAPNPDPPAWPSGDFVSQLTEFAELSSEALTYVQADRKSKLRGRPPRGAFSVIFSNSLPEFTLNLLLDVRAAGGRLTLDKNSGTGTLVKALELLRRHARPGLIPNELPMSTLARVKMLDQKIATDCRSTDNIQS